MVNTGKEENETQNLRVTKNSSDTLGIINYYKYNS